MLISRVPEEDKRREVREGEGDSSYVNNALEYQTASELFDLMSRNHNFRPEDDETLSTRDLVLIYKNIDLGTKLMSNANAFKMKSPNQYVETIVYEDLDSDAEISEICSNEDVYNMMLINDERIDLLIKPSSLDNILCHKHSDIAFRTTDLSAEYNKNTVFKEHFLLEDQLNTFNCMSNSNNLLKNTVLPSSLLDYIWCKSLEVDYNFDMDSIIRYVKRTIEQLERISNGDFLTEKAQEKWREVKKEPNIEQGDTNDAKVLVTKTSIPLYVERKVTGSSTKWDDFIHSEIDIRSLSKILEKKIVVEVPKTLCGSYELFSKYSNDNLIIRCNKKSNSPAVPEKYPKKSHLDVVVQLNRSDSGYVGSEINSIVILQTSEKLIEVLPLSYNSSENISIINTDCKTLTLTEIQDTKNEFSKNKTYIEVYDEITESHKNHFAMSRGLRHKNSSFYSKAEKCNSSVDLSFDDNPSSEDLRCALQNMNMQSSLPEESIEDNSSSGYNKRRSPTQHRIKSPYENKSLVVEEKKRKKFLEIRQRREKKKMALTADNYKINKQQPKSSKNPPPMVNSVTKLSISNKSFYNSIYGNSGLSLESKPSKTKIRKEKKQSIPEVPSEVNLDSQCLSPSQQKNQKFVNKSYYLDNAETEMMYMDMKGPVNQDQLSESGSANDNKMNLMLLSQLMAPTGVEFTKTDATTATCPQEPDINDRNVHQKNKIEEKNDIPLKENQTKAPSSTTEMNTEAKPNSKDQDEKDSKKTSAEFRKSIDKIYELIHKLGKFEGASETKLCKSKFTAVAGRAAYNDVGEEGSLVQCSDSGTSVKHHLTSSNLSSQSSERIADANEITVNPKNKKASPPPATNVVPKIIISAKNSPHRIAGTKKPNPPTAGSDSPLIAISQLLQEFDNVQKTRSKSASEKAQKKQEVTFAESKIDSRTPTKKLSKVEYRNEHLEKNVRDAPRDRRIRQPINVQQQPIRIVEPKSGTKLIKKKDFVDELKEARGEAVRGPSKFNSRLNSLAQPKRTYVKAQIEEFQAKYGRSVVTDRLQKLTGSPNKQIEQSKHDTERRPVSPKLRKRKEVTESIPIIPKESPSPMVLEKSPKKSINNNRDTTPNDKCIKPNVEINISNLFKKVAVNKTAERKPGNFPMAVDTRITDDLLNCRENKSRIPYIPEDIDIASSVGSSTDASALGTKIHHLIDVIIPPNLHDETESEGSKTNSLNKNKINKLHNKNSSSSTSQEELMQPNNNIFLEHKCERPIRKLHEHIIGDTIPEENVWTHESQETSTITGTTNTETENNKNVHDRQLMSVAKFRQRMTVKNEAMQQVLMLQSGDAKSLILKPVAKLTKVPIDFSFARFPMQIPFVGYSFPKYHRAPISEVIRSTNANKVISIAHASSESESSKSDKTIQCYKGGQLEMHSKCDSNIDIKDIMTSSKNLKMFTTTTDKDTTANDKDAVCKHETQEDIGTKQEEIKQNTVINTLENKQKPDNDKKVDLTTIKQEPRALQETINEEERANVELLVEKDATVREANYSQTKTSELIVENEGSISEGYSISSRVDYTRSLDALVGLLNEIQCITSCQSQMADPSGTEASDKQRAEIECILKSAAALENAQHEGQNVISIASLDKLRQLESNGSVLSFCISNNSRQELVKPSCVDKEVNATPMSLVNKCTSVPSQLFPLSVSHSTHVSNSLLGILSEPSSQSVLEYNSSEYPLHRDPSMTSLKLVMQFSKNMEISKPEKIMNNRKMHNFNILPRSTTKFCEKKMKGDYAVHSNFDPVMKMKRDILVTLYSVLVLTVFAALSFQEILYRS